MAAREEFEANPFAAPETDLTTFGKKLPGDDFVYAEFGTRFVAAFVDGLIVNITMFLVTMGITMTMNLETLESGSASVVIVGIYAIQYIAPWLYEALQVSSEAQATLGKRLMGIKVVDLNGQRISFWRATGRHFGKILSALILLIGFIMQQFTAKRQALHDIMAGTLVIKG